MRSHSRRPLIVCGSPAVFAGLVPASPAKGRRRARALHNAAVGAVEPMESRLLMAFSAHVNFQPASFTAPTGYVADTGALYGAQNGLTYGWTTTANPNVAGVAPFTSTDSRTSDLRYTTDAAMQQAGDANAVWQIAVPNGTYAVHVVAGDPNAINGVYKINANNVLVASGTPTSTAKWVSGQQNVTVTNGLITLSNGTGAVNNKIDFVDITYVDVPPTVAITAPATGAVAFPGKAVTLSATAADSDGTVTSVQFYLNGGLLGSGTLTGGQYLYTWTPASPGTISLTAVATDDAGMKTTSAKVSVKIDASPSISMSSPAPGTVFAPGSSTTFVAAASDPDGTVASVNFYVDGALFGGGTLSGGTAASGTWSLPWANMAGGYHTIYAVATDNDGAAATLKSYTIRVNTPPATTLTAPAANSLWLPGQAIALTATATDTDGVKSVQFFSDGQLVGTGAYAGSSAYTFSWKNAPAGTHAITAVATDNLAAAVTTPAVSIRVDAAPSVTLTVSPAPAGASYPPGTSLTLGATASDSDGTVTGVKFVADGVTLGQGVLANGVYTLPWSPAIGTHTVTAIATDNDGGTKTSNAVALRVNRPPTVSITSPANNAVLMPGTVNLAATAADADGGVAGVNFYADGTLLGAGTLASGTAASGSWTFAWAGGASGTHAITAVATDADAATTTSATTTVRIDALPTISLTSPAAGAVVQPGTAIALAAQAADSDGTISSVKFYADGTLLGTGSLSGGLYRFTWSLPAVGKHSITAVTTDNNNGSTTSAAVGIRVNSPPTVSVTSPANATVVQPGGTIALAASASDADGTVTGVTFFDGKTAVGAATLANGAWTFTWSGATIGTHAITAVATDNDGGRTTSAAVSVRVNSPPTVAIASPAGGAVFLPGSTINLAATASDADGTVASVQFFSDGALVGAGSLNNGQYAFAWSNAPAGTHAITAVATDSDGAAVTSSAVSLRVDALPSVTLTTPANNAVFLNGAPVALAATASDADGAVSGVEFFDGTADLGPGAADPNHPGTYTLNLSSLPIGTHTLTAVATDNDGGRATSAAASVRVDAPPAVSITAPADATLVQSGTPISISAAASDSDGTVANVEFFDGATDLGRGTLSGGAYTFNWAGAPAGNHAVTAVATDNDGAATTSAVVNLHVNALPTVALTAPAAGAVFQPSDTIHLAATASDSDGTVANVEFFAAGVDLGPGTINNGQYTFDWAGATPATYAITAVATDNDGGSTTSAAASVRVNEPPAVAVSAPLAGAVTLPGVPVTLVAQATDADGTVTHVEFFDGTTDLGAGALQGGTTNYQFTWNNAPVGTHSLTAVATDSDGARTTSGAVGFRVDNPPAVSVTIPPDGSVVQPGDPIPMAATATDTDGTVTGVEFFDGGTDLGAGVADPNNPGSYTFTYTNAAVGTHSLTAVATDNDGATTTSNAVGARVNDPPAVTVTSPPPGAAYKIGSKVPLSASASDGDGSVTGVEFFVDGADVGAGASDGSGNWNMNWTASSVGQHSVTAVATDNDNGQTTSAAAPVGINVAITIGMTSPADGTVYQPGAAIPLAAQAAAFGGTISKLEFFDGTTDLGAGVADPNNPASYTFTWANASVGTHALFARATDNDGDTADAQSVSVRVNSPPTVAVTTPGGAYAPGQSLTLNVAAADADGTVATVELFDGANNSLGQATSNGDGTYSLVWSAPPVGLHAITAVATDSDGAQTTSAPVSIRINTQAVITSVTGLDVVAGHAVHVHAMDTLLSDGTPLTAKYAWDFGDTDPNARFDQLVGFNAAHVYNTPGTYAVTLRVTDDVGYTATASVNVTVEPKATLQTYYVSSSTGNDSNPGVTTDAPIQTWNRVRQLMSNNTQFLFLDGDTFPIEQGLVINGNKNVFLGSYGSGGAQPILLWDAPRTTGNSPVFVTTQPGTRDVTVSGLTFDSSAAYQTDADKTGVPLAFRTYGTNIAVVGNTFLNVEYVVDASPGPAGLLVQDNAAPLATGLRAYFVYLQGTDAVIIGNTVANSTREHVIRDEGGVRTLVAWNNLTNLDRTSVDSQDTAKGVLTIHTGRYGYFAHNQLHNGPSGVGPLTGTGATDSYQWAVFEDDTFYSTNFLLQPGAQHTMFRNNIIRDNSTGITLNGRDAQGRYVSDATVADNTITFSGTSGTAFAATGFASGIALEDNLYLAPNLTPGSNTTAPVFITGADLSIFSVISHNIWPPGKPNRYAPGGVNYVWQYWSSPSGYLTPAQWNAKPQVNADQFINVTVDGNYAPSAGVPAVTGGVPVVGVWDDYYGTARSGSTWTIGAVTAV